MFTSRVILRTAAAITTGGTALALARGNDRSKPSPAEALGAPANDALSSEPSRHADGQRAMREPLEPMPGDHIERARRTIRTNDFIVRRGLTKYASIFGETFTRDLARLTSRDHLLDAGAGECRAVLDYLAGSAPSARASTTAVSYYVTPRATATIRATPGATLLTGRYFETIPAEELTGRAGKFAVITDVFGVMAYTPEPSRVLNKYLEVLTEGGSIYLQLGVAREDRVRLANGARRLR